MRTAHACEVHPHDPNAILIFGGYGGKEGDYNFLNNMVVLHTDRYVLKIRWGCLRMLKSCSHWRWFAREQKGSRKCWVLGGDPWGDQNLPLLGVGIWVGIQMGIAGNRGGIG